ncbi:peptide deformylase, mitochondrial [Eleutherodactylus coqui]|uniref:Peptide deformylase n=1 Tax=Eleutherodactylus coqui TaxID=57060 RepID=A0A8J6EUD4_ELECQ|nr:hypothetical protein GDO78_003440 [Eleutherodactylus coqui]
MIILRSCRVFGLLVSHYSHGLGSSGPQSSRLYASWTEEKKRPYWKTLRRLILGAPSPPYKKVVQTGDPVLRLQTQLVPQDRISHPDTQVILKRMVHILRSGDCMGISAPQLGVPLRIIALELREGMCKLPSELMAEREIHPFPLKIFINPTMRILDSRKLHFHENCTSLHGFSALVPRCHSVEISGLNEKGDPTSWKAHGWAARAAQHEMDHLDGVLYIDKMFPRTFVNLRWQEVND